MMANLKPWREASSIIVFSKNNTSQKLSKETNNYKILFQKRSDKSKVFPNSIVFPGGTSEQSDTQNIWLNHFESFNIPNEKFKFFNHKNMTITKNYQHEEDFNQRHLTLRIAAIRETFEELGILICKNRHNKNVNEKLALTSCRDDFDVSHWRQKVHKDSQEFLSLCKHLDCYPDIWSLHWWSNWLTPSSKPIKHRFDTLFFLTFFESQPQVHMDQKEVSEYWWSTPKEVLELYKAKKLMLPIPQFYELSRLQNHQNFDRLHEYAALRSNLGCELFFTIYQQTKDGTMVIFPGDDLYPKDPNLYEKVDLIDKEKTLEEINKSSSILHRIIFHDLHNFTHMIKNHTPLCHHLSPVTEKLPLFDIINT